MTLVYAKIINMCGAGPGTGGWGQGVGVKGGQGGFLKLFTIAVGRDVGLWGWGNDRGGDCGGEGGWGEAFIEVLNKTGIVTRLGCRNERYNTKSYMKSWGIPCNDITFSKIRHNLAQKKSENEKARDFTSLSMQEGAAILGN